MSAYTEALKNKIFSSNDLLARRANKKYQFIMHDIDTILKKARHLIATELQEKSVEDLNEIYDLLEVSSPLVEEILDSITDIILNKTTVVEPKEINKDEDKDEPLTVTLSDEEVATNISTVVKDIIGDKSASVDSLVKLTNKLGSKFESIENPITKDIVAKKVSKMPRTKK